MIFDAKYLTRVMKGDSLWGNAVRFHPNNFRENENVNKFVSTNKYTFCITIFPTTSLTFT